MTGDTRTDPQTRENAARNSARDLQQRYVAALRFLPDRAEKLAFNTNIEPQWIDGTDAFWYRRDAPHGHAFVRVDSATGMREPAFDHGQVAVLLAGATGRSVRAGALPFLRFAYDVETDGRTNLLSIRFEIDGAVWRCDLERGWCAPAAEPLPPVFLEAEPDGAFPGSYWGATVPSPDGRFEAMVRDHDLYLRATNGGEERRLTVDGIAGYGYGQISGTVWAGEVSMPRAGREWPAQILWSPDSRRFLTVRVDTRHVGAMHLLDVVPDGRYDRRPILHSYPLMLPGDESVVRVTPIVFEAASGRRIDVALPPLDGFDPPLIAGGSVWWSDDGESLFLCRIDRPYRGMTLVRVDPATGATADLISETAESPLESALSGGSQRTMRVVAGGREVVWLSQQDGWGHLYFYDAESGTMKTQITRGDWAVDEIVHIDEEAGWLYFVGRGREASRDPYYRHFYRVRLDGSDLSLLTPEDAEHEVVMAPSGRVFVDRYSRVDLPTVTLFRRCDGEPIIELEQADTKRLLATGWTPPERFAVLAADGDTPIYGVLYRPPALDTRERYPIVDCVYGGPQVIVAPRSFRAGIAGYEATMATAQLGLFTVNIDGRGTPGRSRMFRDAGEGFTDGCGLLDHIAAIRQLARRYPAIDLNRVGITGYSGGGYTSTRAVFKYPDFYKVAVSGAGSHNQWIEGARWGEAYLGMPADDPDRWAEQSNTALAANLVGKLLLIHGGMDDDTHPANSLQVADALIQAGKEFDFLLVPGLNHGRLFRSPYYHRRVWDYFFKHLLGVEPPDWNRVDFDGICRAATEPGLQTDGAVR